MLSLADSTMLALTCWYGSRKLHECLRRSAGGISCGKWTRRLELSVVEHEDPDHPVSPVEIFLLCPNIETLVKCDDDLLPHSLNGADLRGLKRFDWYYARYRDGDHQFATEDDDPSRGQDFLRDVVKNAPNLQYLSLIKRFRGTPRAIPAPSSLILPALTTLHLELISSDVWTEIETWSFPQLTVLRVDTSFPSLTRSPERTWDTVQVVELLRDQGSLPAPSRIPTILKICPNARELNYYIEYVLAPPAGSTVSAAVQVVCLHFATNYDLRWPVEEEEDALWTHLAAHFSMLAGAAFPSLKRVVLHGPPDSIVADSRFSLFEESLDGRGFELTKFSIAQHRASKRSGGDAGAQEVPRMQFIFVRTSGDSGVLQFALPPREFLEKLRSASSN
ncbi:hypothetical protein C8R47DRAFT_1203448, partial [Mycena vitilis]